MKGTPVTTVSAVDGDKGKYGEIKYELIGEYENTFSVDQQVSVVKFIIWRWDADHCDGEDFLFSYQGMIRVELAGDLDREQAQMITLQVVATDQGHDLETRRSISVPVSRTHPKTVTSSRIPDFFYWFHEF